MDNYETFFHYTFPETCFFEKRTKQVAYMLWGKLCNEKYQEINRFLKMVFKYSSERVEAACEKALYYNIVSIPVIEDILNMEGDLISSEPDSDIEGQLSLPF